jgi:hypothetical protein
MGIISEVPDDEIFVCHVCLIQMKSEETALRLKEKDTDTECKLSYCQRCVSQDSGLKDKQIFLMRMMISQALMGMDTETQKEIEEELKMTVPEEYKDIKDLFGLKRTIEVKDEEGNLVQRVEE